MISNGFIKLFDYFQTLTQWHSHLCLIKIKTVRLNFDELYKIKKKLILSEKNKQMIKSSSNNYSSSSSSLNRNKSSSGNRYFMEEQTSSGKKDEASFSLNIHSSSADQDLKFYQSKCTEMENYIYNQQMKIDKLLQYQQRILEKLEDGGNSPQDILDENLQLTSKLKDQENEIGNLRNRIDILEDQLKCYSFQMRSISEQNEKIKQYNYELEMRLQEEVNSKKDRIKEQQFLKCVIDMVTSCHPPTREPISLKCAWRWLKSVLDDYMQLKKQHERSKSAQYRAFESTMTHRPSNQSSCSDIFTKPVKFEYNRRYGNKMMSLSQHTILVGDIIRNQMKVTESQYLKENIQPKMEK